MKFFETHCHLDFPDYNRDRDEVVAKCKSAGVQYFINVGIDTETISKSIKLAEKYPGFFAAAGYHPNYADRYDEESLRTAIAHPKVIAIGEIGLDYYRNYTCPELQKEVFHKQLSIAEAEAIPVIIHNREANDDCLEIMNGYKLKNAVFHCFAGDLAFARKLWDKGWYISVTAAITYKNCKIIDVIEACPADRLMSETDCPFLAPAHIRGNRNDPSSLADVIAKVSEIRKQPQEEVAAQLFDNAQRFFLQ